MMGRRGKGLRILARMLHHLLTRLQFLPRRRPRMKRKENIDTIRRPLPLLPRGRPSITITILITHPTGLLGKTEDMMEGSSTTTNTKPSPRTEWM
jgi:hypothetical protein